MPSTHDEIVQIVDRHNRKIEHLPRTLMRAGKLTHRASYILVFNDKDEFFLQKRTRTKDIYPGFWDVAAGGVVLADETYEDSARRELAEELGVTGVPLHFLFDHYYEDENNRVWGRIFSCRHNGPFVLQKSEIEGGKFISVAEALRQTEKQPFTPDGVEILGRLQKNQKFPATGTFFLHGLDSSSHGTKGRFFRDHFPHIHCPDFDGPLADRLHRLAELCRGLANVTLVGSSFGGLMATCHAIRFPDQVARLILLAPALNFPDFQPPQEKLALPTLLVIGNGDTVTPAKQVIALARATFADLETRVEEDDHMLHKSFMGMAWHELLQA
jgi:8-oxo-dGTP pyrophosphatase MutT (NUDIX family)/predicted alpha/beta hydrolase family esterase